MDINTFYVGLQEQERKKYEKYKSAATRLWQVGSAAWYLQFFSGMPEGGRLILLRCELNTLTRFQEILEESERIFLKRPKSVKVVRSGRKK